MERLKRISSKTKGLPRRRLQVNFSGESYAIIERIAWLQNRSMSAVVSEWFDVMEPGITKLAETIEKAKLVEEIEKQSLQEGVRKAELQVAPYFDRLFGIVTDLGNEVRGEEPPSTNRGARNGN